MHCHWRRIITLRHSFFPHRTLPRLGIVYPTGASVPEFRADLYTAGQGHGFKQYIPLRGRPAHHPDTIPLFIVIASGKVACQRIARRGRGRIVSRCRLLR